MGRAWGKKPDVPDVVGALLLSVLGTRPDEQTSLI